MQTTTQIPDGISLEALGAFYAIGEATLHRGAPVPIDVVHFLLRVGKFKAGKLVAVLCEAGMLEADLTHLFHPPALAKIKHAETIKKQRSIAGKASYDKRFPNKKRRQKNAVVSEASPKKTEVSGQRALESPLNPKVEAKNTSTLETKPLKTKETAPTAVDSTVSRARMHPRGHPLNTYIPTTPTSIHETDIEPELFIGLPTTRHASKEKPTDEEILNANDLWNSYARDNPNWSLTVGDPTKRRSADIAALLIRARHVHGGLKAVLDRARQPQVWFLNHHPKFRFSLDFLCKSRTKRDDRPVIIQIMEGYYDGRFNDDTDGGGNGGGNYPRNQKESATFGAGSYRNDNL